MTSLLIVVFTVIFTSAMCSLFEAVLYSIPISHIENLINSKRSSGSILRKLREKVDAPIIAILSLNTIANTAGAAIAGAIAAEVLGAKRMVYFSAFFTLGILFLSEIIPKTAGVAYCRPLSIVVAWPIQILVWLFRPLVWSCGLVTKIFSGKRTQDSISEEELIVLAHMGKRAGVIDADEAAVIQNILSLESKSARDIMTPRTVIFSLEGSVTVEESRKDKRIFNHSRIPVFHKNFEDIIGIVHRRDILHAVVDGKLDIKLDSLMKPAQFVLESTKLDKVLKDFLEHHQHMFVVIGELGGLSGVITLEDVLEEILGKEIVDEFDAVTDMRALARKRREQLLKNAGSKNK